MPWIAKYGGEEKTPRQVPRGEDVECVTCGGRMRVWSRSSDGRARHFKHIGNMGHGEGGDYEGCESVSESQQHKVWKSFAADALLEAFEEKIERWAGYDEGEKRELVTETGLQAPKSGKKWRVGDVVMTFDEWDETLGKGIIVEVQHRNESKDIHLTTEDYVQQGYSVIWLYEQDFAEDRCRLTEVDFRQRAFDEVWPDHVPEQDEWESSDYTYESIQAGWIMKYEFGDGISGARAILPREWHDEKALKIWKDQSWTSVFSGSYTEEYERSAVEIEIDIAPFISRERWEHWYRQGVAETHTDRDDLEHPKTGFDDVQCHSCGHYNYWKNAGLECKHCGEIYDWDWNIATGRVKPSSVPDEISTDASEGK